MTQSFGKSIDAAEAGEKQIARSSFYILEDRAVMDFHYSHGRITAKSNEYFKDETTGPDYSAKFKGNDPGHAEDEVAAVWQQEKDCYQEIRNSERQVDDILKHRKI